MAQMNRYLAITHLLSLLDPKATLENFIAQTTDQNPLFQQACLTPGQFLYFLKGEGLLIQTQQHFSLSALGKVLYQHILDWTRKDKKVLQEKINAYRLVDPLKIPVQCPQCHSHYCALNIFCILIERVQQGIAHLNNWNLESLNLITQFLNHHYQNQPIHLFIHGTTQNAQDLVWLDKERLARALAHVQTESDSDLIRNFLTQFRTPLLLRSLPGLRFPHEFVSRLRLDYGLYEANQLKSLRMLSAPEFYGAIYQPWSPPKHFRYIYLSGVGMNADQTKALLHFGEGTSYELLAFEKQLPHPTWRCKKRVLYSIHEEIND